jgi:hypothetical protein
MNKEYRKLTVRATITASDDGNLNKTIVGVIPYNSISEDMGFFEIISSTAFRKTLADKYDVIALFNHDDSKVLGRVSNGSLTLESKPDGLYCSCNLPFNVSYAEDCYNLIKQDYNNTMSFGFIPITTTTKVDDKGIQTDTLVEVALKEVSFGVVFPAYSETDSEARKLEKKEIKIDYNALINRALIEITSRR